MSALEELAAALGLSLAYRDAFGNERQVPHDTLQLACAAFGYTADDDAQARESLARLENERWSEFAPPVVTMRGDGAFEIPLTVSAPPEQLRLHWELRGDDGIAVHGTARWLELPLIETAPDGGAEKRRLHVVGHIQPGYHDLDLTCEGIDREAHVRIVAAPARAYQPPPLENGGRVWALTTQLYALRSNDDWGIGDFAALSRLVDCATQEGAAAVGLNPLHALFVDEPERASPYSPSSRLFLNPLYLNVTAIADFAESGDAQRLVRSESFAQHMDSLRAGDHVDYEAVAAVKMDVLRLLYDNFCVWHLNNPNSPRAQDFRIFRAERGAALRRYATFETMRYLFSVSDSSQLYWKNWPPPYRHPDGAAVAAFASRHIERIEFVEYLQWQTDLQFATVAAKTARSGMAIGLYGDLAVGFDGGGADAWAYQDIAVTGFSAGAPPDPWADGGQNWGFPPLNPRALRKDRYRVFADMLAANMQHVGALRIDHALGLMRIFWVPEGKPASEGLYVDYPLEELLAVIILESHRNKCLVIGEDLGTLPSGLREALQEAGLYSYRLLYFERDADGASKAPGDYPVEAVAAISTHDLPTLAGYWAGADIALRERLAETVLEEDHTRAVAEREHDKKRLTTALRAEGLMVGDDATNAPRLELHRFLARTPSRLLAVQLDDAVDEREQFNLPSTDREYPNWRRRYALSVTKLFADPRAQELFAVLRSERPPLDPPQSD